jgi:hypothetical protein
LPDDKDKAKEDGETGELATFSKVLMLYSLVLFFVGTRHLRTIFSLILTNS